jgi:hypothetical protein
MLTNEWPTTFYVYANTFTNGETTKKGIKKKEKVTLSRFHDTTCFKIAISFLPYIYILLLFLLTYCLIEWQMIICSRLNCLLVQSEITMNDTWFLRWHWLKKGFENNGKQKIDNKVINFQFEIKRGLQVTCRNTAINWFYTCATCDFYSRKITQIKH